MKSEWVSLLLYRKTDMPRLPSNPRNFASRYSGQCQHCKGKIKPGDRISWVRNEYLAHDACHYNAVIQAETRSDPDRANDMYWKNKAAKAEQAQEEAAYRAKMARDAAANRPARNEPCPF